MVLNPTNSLLCSFFTLAFYLSFSGLILVRTEIISTENGPEVRILNGILRGKWQLSRENKFHKGRNYSSFEGIPYAKSPERFQSTESAVNWTGIRDATYRRSICPQVDAVREIFHDETEDCLFANVYVPQVKNAKHYPLPIMFWIHGGGFQLDAGSTYGPKYMMEKDVILVTINYRLGALGFLNTEDGQVEGNMGLKDMIMALKWVQENIGYFGGDAGSVTIFGQSAGGVAVNILMLSPAAEGLFHKAISQSGTALPNWSLNERPKELAAKLGTELNCANGMNDTQMVDCMKTRSIRELLEAQQRLNSIFVLTVDTNSSIPVLPDTPINLLVNPRNQNVSKVPFIVGWNIKEALMASAGILRNSKKLKRFNEDRYDFVSNLLELHKLVDAESGNLERVSREIGNFYFNRNEAITINNLENLTNLITDNFVRNIKKTALVQATYNSHVYPYLFSYKGNFSTANFLGYYSVDPSHGDEIQYLFESQLDPEDHFYWPPLIKESIDEQFSKNLISLWTSFARKGKPASWGEKWKPISSKELNHSTSITTPLSWYNLDSNPKPEKENEDLIKRLEFWETIFP